MQETQRKHTWKADLLLVSVAVIWGLGFPITQMAIDAGIPSGWIVALRFWVAALVMGVAFRRQLRTLERREVLLGAVAGCLLAASFLLQTSGQRYSTPSNAAFLTSLNVVIVPFLSWLLYKQRPGGKLLCVCFSCLVGAAVLTIQPGEGLRLGMGDLLVLACAVGFSLHVAYLGGIAGRVGAAKLTFLQMAFAALTASGYLLVFERAPVTPAQLTQGLPAILYMGLMSTAYSFFAQTYAQNHTSAARAAVILGTEGLLGSVFSVLLGYEPLSLRLVAGGTIIFCSLLVMELDLTALRRRFSPPRLTEPPQMELDSTIGGNCNGDQTL